MNFGTRQLQDVEKQEEVVILDGLSVINDDSLIEVAAVEDNIVVVLNDQSLSLSWHQFKGFVEQIFGVSEPVKSTVGKLIKDKPIKNV